MDKTGLIRCTARKVGCSMRQAEKVINASMAVIYEELANGGEVKLAGFGKFATRRQGESTLELNGKRVRRQAKNVPVFKPGKRMEEVCKGK